jgi:uncharacterized membrane protein
MEPIKKEYIWGFYLLLTLLLALIAYFMSTNNKLEYALAGALVGILISLILWIVWGSKNSY